VQIIWRADAYVMHSVFIWSAPQFFQVTVEPFDL